jgi:hypothetical protein
LALELPPPLVLSIVSPALSLSLNPSLSVLPHLLLNKLPSQLKKPRVDTVL